MFQADAAPQQFIFLTSLFLIVSHWNPYWLFPIAVITNRSFLYEFSELCNAWNWWKELFNPNNLVYSNTNAICMNNKKNIERGQRIYENHNSRNQLNYRREFKTKATTKRWLELRLSAVNELANLRLCQKSNVISLTQKLASTNRVFSLLKKLFKCGRNHGHTKKGVLLF